MEIHILATGSSGNAYTISDGATSLLLDAGIPMKQLQQRTGFTVQRLGGAFITHEHQDHSKAGKDLARHGIDVYASQGTLEACGFAGHRFHPVKPLAEFQVNTFHVLPFDVQHDAAEPLGFLFASKRTGEKLLYFTDTYYIRYRFDGLTHIIGECNYDRDTLWEKIDSGETPEVMAKRLFFSHMGLETFLDFLRANDLSYIRQIYLCHMSNAHGNEARIREAVQRQTGAEVIVC